MEFTIKRILLLAFIIITFTAHAQWSTDPTINNAICTNYYNQSQIQMISDGSGGAIICWLDYRFQPDYTIFAQRISSGGILQWTNDGVQVSPSSRYTRIPSITTDGNGGVIITWLAGGQFGSLYAQHINAGGTRMWDSSGIIICSTTLSEQITPKIVSDGNGGAIIAWGDTRNGGHNNEDLYAQRVNAAGIAQWAANGMAVSNASGFQGGSMQITNDGSGGAIMAWEDHRSGATVEIYTQKINASGAVLWDTDGVLVNSVVGGSLYPQLISDAGGAIICWVDRRNGNTDWNIYAQKVSTNGSVQWTANGEAICLASSNQTSPQLASDGNGGAIITWDEPGSATNTNPNIYAQRVNASGVAEWVTNGIGVCLAANGQRFPQLTSDGNGGAVITWQDARTNNIHDIYAQRIDSSGSALWTNDGVAVSTATYVQSSPIILNDGNNGEIIAWTDLRNDLTQTQRKDIFAQRVNADGSLGGVTDVNESLNLQPSEFSLEQNYPNPFNPSTIIKFSIPNEDLVSLKVFNSLGEEVSELINETKPAGNYSVSFDASKLSSGVYFYKISAGNFIETKKMILMK